MKRFGVFGTVGSGLFFLIACSSATVTPRNETVTKTQGIETPTKVKPATPTQQATIISPENTNEPPSFLLSEPGSYFAGNRVYTIVDESRNSREIELLIWYPAQKQTDADGRMIVRNAVPDLSGAPYPVILTEKDTGGTVFLSHLTTHGFVLVVVKSQKSARGEEFNWIQYARDFLFSLDQISATPPEGLENLMDTDRVGVTGFSYGGDVSIAMSGARIDPEFYLSQCSQMTTLVPSELQWVFTDWTCLEYQNWDAFVSYVGEETTSSEDGLWQPMADPRIRAVMPMAPSVSWYYGERGLAAVDRPTLILWGTKDNLASYEFEAEYTFEHIGTPDRFLISFVGRTHSMPFVEDVVLRMRHFAVAFFGYYLQGREDYVEYFSEDFVTQSDDLAWGVYSDK